MRFSVRMVACVLLAVAAVVALAALASVITVPPSITPFAQMAIAEDAAGWARVVAEDVYLFVTEDDTQRLFVLEKSYYLQIRQETERMYLVFIIPGEACPTISGYVLKTQVTLCAVPPLTPYYPAVTVTVQTGSAPLRLSPLPSAASEISALDRQTLHYYGAIESYGSTWYYVYYGGKHGYVNAGDVTAPNVPLHPTPLPSKPTVAPPESTQPEAEPEPQQPAPTSEILLIVFVVLLAVGLTLALFLPGNLKKRTGNVFKDI